LDSEEIKRTRKSNEKQQIVIQVISIICSKLHLLRAMSSFPFLSSGLCYFVVVAVPESLFLDLVMLVVLLALVQISAIDQMKSFG
jgi:hypothetical protein